MEYGIRESGSFKLSSTICTGDTDGISCPGDGDQGLGKEQHLTSLLMGNRGGESQSLRSRVLDPSQKVVKRGQVDGMREGTLPEGDIHILLSANRVSQQPVPYPLWRNPDNERAGERLRIFAMRGFDWSRDPIR